METGRLSNLAKNIIPPPCFPFAVRSPESFRRFEHQRSVSKKEKKKKGRGKKASTMSLYRRSLFSPSTQVFSILATRLREKFDSSRNFTDVNLLHLTFEDGEALRWMERRWTSIEKDGKSFDPRGITILTVITKSRIRIGGKVSCRSCVHLRQPTIARKIQLNESKEPDPYMTRMSSRGEGRWLAACN